MSKYLEGEAIHRISPMATVPQRMSPEVLHPVGPHLEQRSVVYHRTHDLAGGVGVEFRSINHTWIIRGNGRRVGFKSLAADGGERR